MKLLNSLLLFFAFAAVICAQELPPTLRIELGEGQGFTVIHVVAGRFVQGSPATEKDREDDETQREVSLTKDFFMSETVITRGQFEQFVRATHYRTEAETGTSGGFGVVDGKLVQRKDFTWRNPGFVQTNADPVSIISYKDALAFCAWLSRIAERECTLPTEAQWEYACRAGSAGARYAEPADTVAWYRENSAGITHPVNQKAANPWGFHDMYGPVWQWCLDWYAPYAAGAEIDPLQRQPAPGDKARRVLRGGSFISGVSHARSGERYRSDPQSRNADIGFRIVCSTQQRTATTAASPSQPPISKPLPRPSVSAPSPRPMPVARPSSSGSGFEVAMIGFLLLPVAIILSAIVLVIKQLRGRPSALPSSLVPRSTNLRSRPQSDGFWITGDDSLAGQQVHYRCEAGGTVHEDTVAFAPGPQGHFIFTGAEPTAISLTVRDLAWLQGGTSTVRGPGAHGLGRGIGVGMHMSQSHDDDDTRRHSATPSVSRPSRPSAY